MRHSVQPTLFFSELSLNINTFAQASIPDMPTPTNMARKQKRHGKDAVTLLDREKNFAPGGVGRVSIRPTSNHWW